MGVGRRWKKWCPNGCGKTLYYSVQYRFKNKKGTWQSYYHCEQCNTYFIKTGKEFKKIKIEDE